MNPINFDQALLVILYILFALLFWMNLLSKMEEYGRDPIKNLLFLWVCIVIIYVIWAITIHFKVETLFNIAILIALLIQILQITQKDASIHQKMWFLISIKYICIIIFIIGMSFIDTFIEERVFGIINCGLAILDDGIHVFKRLRLNFIQKQEDQELETLEVELQPILERNQPLLPSKQTINQMIIRIMIQSKEKWCGLPPNIQDMFLSSVIRQLAKRISEE